MAFIRGANPIWSLVDLVGKQFDDTFYLWVLENQIPYIPAQVYHDIDGNIPWTSPIRFLANGTLPVDIFWNDTVVYRLEFRKNDGTAPPSQADALIYLVENYSPSATGGTPATITESVTTNQISNGQFAEINFTAPYNLAATNPPSIEVAPGWFLDLTGTGTLLLERLAINDTIATPTNAPYALRINLGGGWTGVPVLRQRLQQNGVLWASQYVSSSFTARIEGPSQTITARLDASDGQPLAVLETAVLTNAFTEFHGEALLPISTNANTPPAAYVDFKILLPTVCDIYLTSFQIIASSTPINLPYEQDTIDRQLDHLFHYYNPLLQYKPIPSYLTGWDFPLNPAQLGTAIGPIATGANKSFYSWDQTIIFQSTDNSMTVSRVAASGAIELTATIAGSAAIIQYLDQTQAREILSGNCSIRIKAKSSIATQAMTIGLYATNDANLPSVANPTYNSIVATMNATGVATFNGNWTELTPRIPGAVVSSITSSGTETSFTGWSDNITTPRVADATFFAIVIGFPGMLLNETVIIDYISLNAGNIATRPAPQTSDEVLRECERYYWKSFETSTVPAQAIGLGTGEISWTAQAVGINSNGNVEFAAAMRAVPTITLFNPVNANAFAFNNPVNLDCNPTAAANISTKRFRISSTSPAGAAAGSTSSVHATADARLGVVN